MPHLRLTLGALSVAIAGAVAGCSSDDPATAEGAEQAVRDYLKAFSDRDYDDICDAWTEDYQERSIDEWNSGFGSDDPVKSCETLLRQGLAIAEAFGEDLDPTIGSVSSEQTGETTAEVTVVYEGEDEDDGNFTLVYDDGSWLVDDETDDETAAEDQPEVTEPTDEPSEEPTEAAAEPTTIGVPATLGDWTITVTDVNEDAAKEVEKANEFNEPAREQYLLVTLSATYNGAERSADASFDLQSSLTGTDAVVLDPASVVTPFESQDEPTEVRSGGTVQLQVPFDVEPALASGGLFTVSTFDGESEQYVDYQL